MGCGAGTPDPLTMYVSSTPGGAGGGWGWWAKLGGGTDVSGRRGGPGAGSS